jgi:hypothetical protein
MAKHYIQKEVRDHFPYYSSLKDTEKTINSTTILLEERGNHKGRAIGFTPLHCTTSSALLLVVEANVNVKNDFQFKIIDENLMRRPCFRFDSTGLPHFNLLDIPLLERVVKTPHFHIFTKEGIEIAYKTDILNKNEQIFLNCSELALSYFFQEENILFKKSPEIVVSGQLLPPETDVDPLEGESFHE